MLLALEGTHRLEGSGSRDCEGLSHDVNPGLILVITASFPLYPCPPPHHTLVHNRLGVECDRITQRLQALPQLRLQFLRPDSIILPTTFLGRERHGR